ncbi:2-nitropropane dioxygenase [Rhodotorula diobovata]|uniref:2-nitropropane dioxygenase n=1 Tax=Rhodotorula diobovata TaxID=5288 RepID=A0A5C5FJQ7_9BASI|nr:2-nitropropane dioxygenase [Rhodotorula diobovata]
MAGVAGGHLAAEVHKAGGVGFIGGGHKPLESLEAEVAKARTSLGLSSDDDLPLGIGLILWRLEPPHLSGSAAQTEPDRWLRYVIHTARAASLWLAFSGSGDLQGWVERARRVEKEGERRERLKVVVMVQRAEVAKEALGWDGVDAIVLQGTESGGHGPSHSHGAPLSSLAATLSTHVPNPTSPPFVLGAGGLSSPTSISAALAPGILAGVVPGTALCVAHEATLPHAQKELLVRASGAESVRGMSWDEARGTLGWPEGVDGRAIRNRTSEEERGVAGTEEGRERYKRAVAEGDVERVVTWAGTGVGDVKRIAPAQEIVRELMSEVVDSP